MEGQLTARAIGSMTVQRAQTTNSAGRFGQKTSVSRQVKVRTIARQMPRKTQPVTLSAARGPCNHHPRVRRINSDGFIPVRTAQR